MMTNNERSEFGLVKIHNNVLASIAFIATQEIEGISRICDNLMSKALTFCGKKTRCGGIDVHSEKNDSVTITIPVVVKYGYNIPDVAAKIQEKTKAALEEATDIIVKDIVIKIKGVEK